MYVNDIPKPVFKKMKTHAKPTTAEGVRRNMAWLKAHHREYQWQWVALDKGTLVGANESLVELHRAVKNAGKMSTSVFMNLKIEM
ncbi:MAG: hypothetical protein DRR19_23335 [Candidatus Parabeggiatoa sp. nov. 1]|nr:MAG: hypothetical protein DRR19_23335 [Gammaproteobacteria bacterium]